jgi:NADH:ubiquinone oxidoreductase subunit 6 (subunit J)
MHGQITFFVLAGIAIFSAVMMVSRAKTLSSAFYFTLTLLATAGIFLQLRAPILFAAQLLGVACVLIGIIVFAVEVGKLGVAFSAEYSWRSRVAGIVAALALALEATLVLLQHRIFPGEKVTELLPRPPLPWPLSVSDVAVFFYSHDLLPLALLLFLFLIAALGIGTVNQRRA